MTLGAAAARLKDWFVDDALALWAARGYDAQRGGFYESLDFNADPVIGQPRRVRVQARQIYTFSQAGALGWNDNAEALAAEGFDYFLARACPDRGARGCVHLLSDDGTVLDDRRDLYDQAFLLLACAGRWRAAKDSRALDLARRTVSFLNEALLSPHGGWRESDQGERPRRQNPHMHLFESFLALFRATRDDAHLAAAANIFTLFERFFFDREKGLLLEFFADDWTCADGDTEPGHMIEWAWLLAQYDDAQGSSTADIQQRLFRRAKEIGLDRAGFVLDAVRPAAPNAAGPRRLWPQLEYVRTALAMARRGERDAASDAAGMIERLFDTYLLHKTAGLWCDQYDGDGHPIAKDVPASILYHLFGAAAEADATLAIEGKP